VKVQVHADGAILCLRHRIGDLALIHVQEEREELARRTRRTVTLLMRPVNRRLNTARTHPAFGT
jgi:hypothetical protein